MICIMLRPISTTFASVVNMPNKNLPADIKITLRRIAVTSAMPRHSLVPLRTRSIFPAPKFWPTNVVAAIPNALLIIQKRLSILPNAAHAAIVSTPNPFNAACTITFEILYMLDSIPVGSPMASIFFSTLLWILISRGINFKPAVWYINATLTSTALIPCAISVATATPRTPILNPSTSTRSRIILTMQQMIRK